MESACATEIIYHFITVSREPISRHFNSALTDFTHRDPTRLNEAIRVRRSGKKRESKIVMIVIPDLKNSRRFPVASRLSSRPLCSRFGNLRNRSLNSASRFLGIRSSCSSPKGLKRFLIFGCGTVE